MSVEEAAAGTIIVRVRIIKKKKRKNHVGAFVKLPT